MEEKVDEGGENERERKEEEREDKEREEEREEFFLFSSLYFLISLSFVAISSNLYLEKFKTQHLSIYLLKPSIQAENGMKFD